MALLRLVWQHGSARLPGPGKGLPPGGERPQTWGFKGKAKAPEIDLATDVGVGITIKDLMAKEEISYKEAVSVYFAFQDSLKGKRAQPCKDSTNKKKTAKANPSPPDMDEEPAKATSKKSLARPKSRPSREKPKPAAAANGVKRKNACSDLGACEESEAPPAIKIRSKSAPVGARTNEAQAPPERTSKKASKAATADLAAEDDDGGDGVPDHFNDYLNDLADGNYPQVLEKLLVRCLGSPASPRLCQAWHQSSLKEPRTRKPLSSTPLRSSNLLKR